MENEIQEKETPTSGKPVKKFSSGNHIKTSTMVLLLVLMAVIFALAGYLFGFDRGENDQISSATATVTATATISATSSATATTSATASASGGADVTANWKTYTNSTLGFTFKYPSTMAATDTLSPDSSKNVANKLLLKEGSTTLEVFVNPDGFGPFFDDMYYELEKSGTGLKISQKQKNEEGGTANDGVYWIYANLKDSAGNITYMFHYKFDDKGADLTSTFDKIIGSFQFTK